MGYAGPYFTILFRRQRKSGAGGGWSPTEVRDLVERFHNPATGESHVHHPKGEPDASEVLIIEGAHREAVVREALGNSVPFGHRMLQAGSIDDVVAKLHEDTVTKQETKVPA